MNFVFAARYLLPRFRVERRRIVLRRNHTKTYHDRDVSEYSSEDNRRWPGRRSKNSVRLLLSITATNLMIYKKIIPKVSRGRSAPFLPSRGHLALWRDGSNWPLFAEPNEFRRCAMQVNSHYLGTAVPLRLTAWVSVCSCRLWVSDSSDATEKRDRVVVRSNRMPGIGAV
jgi:hypothetical protein